MDKINFFGEYIFFSARQSYDVVHLFFQNFKNMCGLKMGHKCYRQSSMISYQLGGTMTFDKILIRFGVKFSYERRWVCWLIKLLQYQEVENQNKPKKDCDLVWVVYGSTRSIHSKWHTIIQSIWMCMVIHPKDTHTSAFDHFSLTIKLSMKGCRPMLKQLVCLCLDA